MNNSRNYFQNLSKNIRGKISQRPNSNYNNNNTFISNETSLNEFSSEIDQLFNNETLDQDITINGKVSCAFLEVDEILIKSIDEDSDLSGVVTSNQINNISNLSAIRINSSSLENCTLQDNSIINNKYYLSQSPSFNYQLLNNIDIIPNTGNDKGWIGCSYIRNLRSSLNESDYDYFFLDTLGDTYFKTTNGNLCLGTFGDNSNNELNNVIINSHNNLILTSNNTVTIDSTEGVNGIKYYCLQNVNNVDLSSKESNTLLEIDLSQLSNVNLPDNSKGFNCKIILSDSSDNLNNFTLNTTGDNPQYLYGFVVYSDNKIQSIGSKNNLITKITFHNKNGINLNGTNIDLYSTGNKWSIKIYCSESSNLDIINYD